MGIRCCHLSKAGRGRRQPERRSKGASQSPAPGAFPLGRLIVNAMGRFFSFVFRGQRRILLRMTNCNQAFSPVVDGSGAQVIIFRPDDFGGIGRAAQRGSRITAFLFLFSNSSSRGASVPRSRSGAFHFLAATWRNAAGRFSFRG
jgi:hypothetical protein